MGNNDIIPNFDDNKNDQVIVKLALVPSMEECIRVSLVGTVDTYNSQFLTNQLEKVLKTTSFKKIWLDMKGMYYMSSTGIGALSGAAKIARNINRRFVLSEIQPKVMLKTPLIDYLKASIH